MSLPSLPAPAAAVLHVHAAAGSLGPMSRAELAEKLTAGEVAPDDHFWFDGMSGWAPISAHPDLLAGLEAAHTAGPATPRPDAAASVDDRLDAVFGGLVKASWEYYEDHAFASHVDEVFLGAIITGTLDTGYSLIDLTSDGTHHYLRFENLQTKDRIIVRFTHLTPGLAEARALGQRASVVIGYGERVKDFTKVWSALKAEYKSGFLTGGEPGTISVDGDVPSQYVYVQVPLFLTIDDYVGRDYKINHALLQEHLGGTVHALRKYLRGRF